MTLPGFAELAIDYSDEWYTPRWVLDPLGAFDLDPCAALPAQRPWDTAAEHLTIADDGLAVPWSGRVWLNPPYSDIEAWMRKMAHHDHGTALVFARTETGWFHEQVWARASGCLFLRGRIQFVRGDGREASSAQAPSALVAYGDSDLATLRECGIAGRLVDLRAVVPTGDEHTEERGE